MEGATTNNELLAQDDIDSLLTDANQSKEEPEEPPEQPAVQEGGATSSDFLGQDDIDALFSHADKGEEPDESLPEKHVLDTLDKSKRKSDEEVRAMSVQLYNRGYLTREKDVKVIWNASGTLPMNSGIVITIQGTEYISLGILHEKHLVVRYKE